ALVAIMNGAQADQLGAVIRSDSFATLLAPADHAIAGVSPFHQCNVTLSLLPSKPVSILIIQHEDLDSSVV
ncbi:hypothetical protein, partial [Streptomyces sp. P17]|uniref:hypothetical protein n=1 Tax=Streptomyces sp. P17 TaxID=3074716 RepID=UPI0028F45DBE